MDQSEPTSQERFKLRLVKQYHAIQHWSFLNKIPFTTIADKDSAVARWVKTGCAKTWNHNNNNKG